MNCCNNNENGKQEKNNHPHKGHMSHMWMMALCCLAPLILVFAISLLGASFPGLTAALLRIVPFIYPVMMIAMIPMMFRHGKHDGNRSKENPNEAKHEVKRFESNQ